MKKNAFWVFLTLSIIGVSGFFASDSYAAATTTTATGYEPLVKIPGVDATEVDISNYLIGIYNFLLSIVGIVAVVMLIIGGMKYIMAAGSGGAVSSAKETIKDAILGLLLAILSYVIVGTINPDVLYLRQPGATFSKDNTSQYTIGSYSSPKDNNGDGVFTVIYTSPEGYQREISLDTSKQLMAGEIDFEATAEEKVALMEKDLSCILPGSFRTSSSTGFQGTCICLTGITPMLPEETSCNVACERENLCGYKFISVKLNARHGYTVNGNIDTSTDAGDTATGKSSTEDEEDIGYEYDLTKDTNVHSDSIWELEGVNDKKWGDFNITYSSTTEMQNMQGGITSKETGVKDYVLAGANDQELYPCAILLTNKGDLKQADSHWVYWVKLGTTLGEHKTLYEDIKGGFQSNCTEGGGGYYGIDSGECDQAWTDRVLLAKYGDDVMDSCDHCDLAAQNAGYVYRFSKKVTCQGGYWQ